MTNTYYLATTYGAGTYDSSTYNGDTAGATTAATGSSTGGSSAGGTGALTDTGIAIALVVTLASIILLTALIVRVWKRPVAVPVTVDEE